MKRLLLAPILLFLLSAGALRAQLREVVIDIRGNYSVIVEVGEDTYAEVSEYGELLDVYSSRTRERENSGNRHRRRPGSFYGVSIEYYDNFWKYRAGKIAAIGNVRFDYNDDFWGYKAGKLSRAGGTNISYHDDFWNYKAGKVSNIGSIRFDYLDNFREEKSGLLQSVNNYRYDYSFPFGSPRPQPQPRRHGRFDGPAVKGEREVVVGKVTVLVVDRL